MASRKKKQSKKPKKQKRRNHGVFGDENQATSRSSSISDQEQKELELELRKRLAKYDRRMFNPALAMYVSQPDLLNSKGKISKKLKIPRNKLRHLERFSSELRKRPPFDLGKCVLELLVSGMCTIDYLEQLDDKSTIAAVGKHIASISMLHMFAERSQELDDLSLSEKEHTLQFAEQCLVGTMGDLQPGQSAAVAIGSPKTAAIFNDRIWCLDPAAPRNIRFSAETPEELICRGLFPFIAYHRFERKEQSFSTEEWLEEVARLYSNAQALRIIEIECARRIEPMICSPVTRKTGRHVPAFTASEAALAKHLGSDSSRQVLAFVLQSVPVVDESQLEWQQVEELRNDDESRKKVRRLLNWIDAETRTTSLASLSDKIHMCMDEYTDALAKHGVLTNKGCIEALLDWKAVSALVASAGIAIETGSAAALLASGLGGTAFLGKALFTSRTIARELRADLGTRPVAILCDLQHSPGK